MTHRLLQFLQKHLDRSHRRFVANFGSRRFRPFSFFREFHHIADLGGAGIKATGETGAVGFKNGIDLSPVAIGANFINRFRGVIGNNAYCVE